MARLLSTTPVFLIVLSLSPLLAQERHRVYSDALLSPKSTTPPDSSFAKLLPGLVQFVKQKITEDGQLLPTAAAITTKGTGIPLIILDTSLAPPQIVEQLLLTLQRWAREGIDADGIDTLEMGIVCMEIVTNVPDRAEKMQAVAIAMENRAGIATAFIIPFVRDAAGKVEYLEGFYREQPRMIFAGQ